MPYLLVLDEGTTSSRALLFDEHAALLGMAQEEHPQIYPMLGTRISCASSTSY
ncbi:MAG: FGGY family carbohydrate kinase [bacterium]